MDINLQQSLPSTVIQEQISSLQRTYLINSAPSINLPIWGEFEGIHFYRVRGVKLPLERWRTEECVSQVKDLLISINALNEHFYFLIFSNQYLLNVYLGCGSREKRPDIVNLLSAVSPGIQIASNPEIALGRRLSNEGLFRNRGILTGIPSIIPDRRAFLDRKKEDESNAYNTGFSSPVERLVQGLQGKNWGFFVHAQPIESKSIRSQLAETSEFISRVHSTTKLQVQKIVQESTRETEEKQTGTTFSLAGERYDRNASFLLSLLELKEKQLQTAIVEGGWKTEAHFFSDDKETLAIQNALIRSSFHAGGNSYEPIKTFVCSDTASRNEYDYSTTLISSELASLAYFPADEAPGYSVKERTSFDVDQENDLSEGISLGKVIANYQKTELPYKIPLSSFARHTFVGGMTGSGKTTTVKELLLKLSQQTPKIPFMVIEPTKSEYRELLAYTKQYTSLSDMVVYTLGDENANPLKINPFQFEFDDTGNHVHVQTHIDFLKSVFNAAFSLYPPMPYVLEICLHEIYADRGWNLITNQNERLLPENRHNLSDWGVFPTLQDLHRKVDEVTNRLGYSYEVERDVKAALQTRLESMMTGGKGVMLNAPIDEGMESLLNQNCVLELEKIGDDEQKAFIMGLIMTRLYEYRQVQRDSMTEKRAFQHLTVIEEAHRLLKAPSGHQSPEFPNPAKQSVETFANLLAEVRAFGEGIMIVEQIPSKLIPDALKNTNLKILHRMVPEDERNLLKGMANMSSHHSRYLINIPIGEAIIHSHTDDRPILINIDSSQSMMKRPSDKDIQLFYNSNSSMAKKSSRRIRIQELSSKYQLACKLNSDRSFLKAWHLASLYELTKLSGEDCFASLLTHWGQQCGMASGDLRKAIMAFSEFDPYFRGLENAWLYEDISEFSKLQFKRFSCPDENSRKASLTWLMKKTERKSGPFLPCSLCSSKCYLLYDMHRLIRASNFLSQVRSYDLGSRECFESLLNLIVDEKQSQMKGAPIIDLGLCLLGQVFKGSNLIPSEQLKITDDFIVYQEERR